MRGEEEIKWNQLTGTVNMWMQRITGKNPDAGEH